MKKITLLFFFALLFISTQQQTVDDANTEPYHNFDWLDEDDYTISVAYTTGTPYAACCLSNGTKVCKGDCTPESLKTSCKFTGASCKADSDNPSTKFYYALYCAASCDESTDYTSATSVDVTVAISGENYIKFSFILLLSLLVL